MNEPIRHRPVDVTDDITCFPATLPVPGFGVLPVNSYLIGGAEPVLVDTGAPALAGSLLDQLEERVGVSSIRHVFVTHADADHVGALTAILARAPLARVVTNYLGMGKLSMWGQIDPERFYLLNPGQELAAGDRRLRACTLPSYDAPETMGLYDPKGAALFSSDCFGALLPEPVRHAGNIPARTLAEGLTRWATVDAPWLAQVDALRFRTGLDRLRGLHPAHVLSAHLPPAEGLMNTLASLLDGARAAEPFVGPDQAALMAMMAA